MIPRSDISWKGCSKANPCRVCGSTTWCFTSPDGDSWGCRKRSDGTEGFYHGERVDSTGSPYHLYFRDAPAGKGKKETRARAKRDEGKQPKAAEIEILPPDRLGLVYGALLQRLTLDKVDRESLLENLTAEEIEQHRFRSLPSEKAGDRISRELFAEFGEDLVRVPGFYRAKDGSIKLVSWSRGWLFPYPSTAPSWMAGAAEGLIGAIRVRWRVPRNPKDKYAWLSSAGERYNGVGVDGCAALFGGIEGPGPRVVYFCEGEKKGIVAARHFGTAAVSVPGVTTFRTAHGFLKDLRPDLVVLAYDADREFSKGPGGGFLSTYHWLKSEGYQVAALRWWDGLATEDTDKGLDDAQKVGRTFHLIEGEELEEYIAELMGRFGQTPPPAPDKAPPSNGDDDDETPKEALMRLAAKHFEFITDRKLYVSFLAKKHGGATVRRTEEVDLNQASVLVRRLRLLAHENMVKASDGLVRTVALILAEQMSSEAPSRPVTIRTQEYEGRVYIDLMDDVGSVVEIHGGAWRVVQDSPARFIRRPDMAPLPYPKPGGRVEDLFKYLRVVTDEHKRLIVCYILQALLPRGPYPLLIAEGGQGAGKTSFSRMVAHFVEPLVDDVGSLPTTEEDFAVHASTNHMLVYDNCSGVQGWLSDALCRASTGGHYGKRQKYSDANQVRLRLDSPVIMTGISGLVGAPDLMDRAVYVQLKAFPPEEDGDQPEPALTLEGILDLLRSGEKRISETHLKRALAAEEGQIFGAILDTLAKALHLRETTSFPTGGVRLADFSQLSQAAASALGWGSDFFLQSYRQMKADLVVDTIEKSPVAESILRLLETNREWSGTPTSLLETLDRWARESVRAQKYWPKTPAHLSAALKRQEPFLRQLGIQITSDRRGKRGDRFITLTNLEYGKALPPAPVPLSIGSETPRYSAGYDDIDALAEALPGFDDDLGPLL